MERGKRRLVTHTNPFITNLTENGIKTNKSGRRKSKTVGACLSLLVRSVLNFLFLISSFLLCTKPYICAVFKITSTDFRVRFKSKVRRIGSLSSNELLRL